MEICIGQFQTSMEQFGTNLNLLIHNERLLEQNLSALDILEQVGNKFGTSSEQVWNKFGTSLEQVWN